MNINKILNNNVVITSNENNEEIIVMGKGLGYGKKRGEEIDDSKIKKIFEISNHPHQKRLINLLKDIPIDYIDIVEQVIQKAKIELQVEIDETLYISLTDHIHTSIERYKEGISLPNHLLMEIKHFYRKEYELGLWTLDLIRAKYDISMDEGEAGFIAMHIVSSEFGRNISDVYEITDFIGEVLEIVKDYFDIDFDTETLSYYRFITHLKYFRKRMFSINKQGHDDSLNNDLLTLMKEKYVRPYLCVLEIKNFIERKYNYHMDNEEILYLTIHVAKVISNK